MMKILSKICTVVFSTVSAKPSVKIQKKHCKSLTAFVNPTANIVHSTKKLLTNSRRYKSDCRRAACGPQSHRAATNKYQFATICEHFSNLFTKKQRVVYCLRSFQSFIKLLCFSGCLNIIKVLRFKIVCDFLNPY